ncbi:MAG: transposase [Thermoplasmatales archaeon]|nr:transposase [Thermoplasmatales archaeon]
MEEVKRFQLRPLNYRYMASFLDALPFFLRRDAVEKEPVMFGMLVEETEECEVLGFYIASKESHNSYVDVINDLYERGVSDFIYS